MSDLEETLQIGRLQSALGDIWIAASSQGVRVVTVPGSTREQCLAKAMKQSQAARLVEDGPILEQALAEMEAYFKGKLRHFEVPLDLIGTPFRRRVWAAVREVPFGETATYGQIAARIGSPSAFRAVGAANGANPAAIIVPCHRLVGSRGELIKYGGGLAQKQWLLERERERFSW